eukprot:3529009-Lingulodinium_polyedra.AAC.1
MSAASRAVPAAPTLPSTRSSPSQAASPARFDGEASELGGSTTGAAAATASRCRRCGAPVTPRPPAKRGVRPAG